VSVARCSNSECKRYYWRYRGDAPPRGYCSVKCFETRRKRRQKLRYETSAQVLEAFRDHRIQAHGTRDIVQWFDCDLCERFEERYAASMYL